MLIVEETLLFLANTSFENLARTSAAALFLSRIRKVDSGLFGSLETEVFVGAGKARSSLNPDLYTGPLGGE